MPADSGTQDNQHEPTRKEAPMNKRFAISIPHAPVSGTTVTVDAATFGEAKARAYRAYADALYAALSPADKRATDAALIAQQKSAGERMSPSSGGGPWKPRLSAERLREIKNSLIGSKQTTEPMRFR
jgi:hypothetical protein